MAFPWDQLSNPWIDFESLNASKLFSRITANLNALASAATFGQIGESTTGGTVTLSTTSAFASTCAVTFTLTSQRRVRIYSQAAFSMASGTSGHYTIRSGYCTGSSAAIGSFVGVGANYSTLTLAVAGGNGAETEQHEGTALLAAGTYTAFASVQRNANGSTTDTATTFYVAVYDVGGT